MSPSGPAKRDIGFVLFVLASDAKLRVPERDDSLGARRAKYEKLPAGRVCRIDGCTILVLSMFRWVTFVG